MKALNTLAVLLTLFITTPIWYYLMYSILKRVDASDVMWLLFWIYVPVGLFAQACMKLFEEKK